MRCHHIDTGTYVSGVIRPNPLLDDKRVFRRPRLPAAANSPEVEH